MIVKLILYIVTIATFRIIILFTPIIPNLILGIINRFVLKTRMSFMHPFALTINLLTTIGVILIYNLAWLYVIGENIPIAALIIIIILNIRHLCDPCANFANKHAATEAIVSCIIFGMLLVIHRGCSGASWW